MMQLTQFSTNLIKLSQAVGTEAFYPELESLFKEWFEFDELLVLKLHKQADAQLLYRYGKKVQGEHLEGEDYWRYLTRLYVLDPYYRTFADKQRFGFFALEEIAPDEFANIYHSYFNFLSLSDEVGYLFELDDNSCLHIDLSIASEKKKFDPQTLAQLRDMNEPLSLLVAQHFARSHAMPATHDSETQIILTNFGRDLLTNKEYQVCQLLLQGHSTKAIGHIMEIGFETVKMHKKNVYAKTFTSSQSELLALFIETILQSQLDTELDYLALHASDSD